MTVSVGSRAGREGNCKAMHGKRQEKEQEEEREDEEEDRSRMIKKTRWIRRQ
jgi:hypothetical protein